MSGRREAASAGEAVFADPAASDWLKHSLRSALTRDPLDALNDALVLAQILEERLRGEFELAEVP